MKDTDIIILGMGPSRHECPWDQLTTQAVYVCNTGYRQVAEMEGKLSHIFLAHTQVIRGGHKNFRWEEYNYLASKGIEVYNTHRVKGLNSKMYPLKRIGKKFNTNYFSDTIAYMVAFAVDYATDVKDGKPVLNGKCDCLRFYGVDMHEFGEYGLEKGGIEFWIGWARGLGMDIEISQGSTLLRTVTGKPYGEKTISIKQLLKGTGINPKTIKEVPGAILYADDHEFKKQHMEEADNMRELIEQRKLNKQGVTVAGTA
jgi:hypothetical protein